MAYYAKMKYLWLSLVFFVLPLNAEIYRWQDESGRIIYSDQPHPDAEIIKVTKSTNYKPPVVNNIPDEGPEAAEESQGYNISILSPQEGEAIWANGTDGNLPVSVDLQPELNVEKGERLLISLDGAAVGEPQASTNFNVPIIERGEHTIRVSLINEEGVTLATSPAVNFQLHRASIRNNQ